MNSKRMMTGGAALLVLILVFLLALGAAAETVPGRTAPTAVPGDWECLAGQACHVLIQPGSSVYVLTADGRARVDIFGDDSIRIGNVER